MQVKHVGPVVQLLHEALRQLGSPLEEVLLQGGQGLLVQGPQEPVLAEERVVGEQVVHGWSLAHVKTRERERLKSEAKSVSKSGSKVLFLNVFSLVMSCWFLVAGPVWTVGC